MALPSAHQQLRLASKSLLLVSGTGSKQFLQGLITKNMNILDSVPLIYAFLLNVKGRIVADLFVWRLSHAEEAFALECNTERMGSLEKALKLYRLRRRIGIEPMLDKQVHFRCGNQETALNSSNEAEWLQDPRVRGFGRRSIVETANGGNTDTAHDQVYLRHRLEWGLAEGGEMADQIPMNVNGDLTNGISLEKGCYIGQELVARTHHLGVIRRRLMPFRALQEDENGNAVDGTREGNLLDARGRRQGKILCSHRSLSGRGLCIVSLEAVPPGDTPSRLFDAQGRPLEVWRPNWWPPDAV